MKNEIIILYSFGQQVKSKNNKKLSKKYIYIICDVDIIEKNNYSYGVTKIFSDGGDSQWWVDHKDLELILNGEITNNNLKIAFKAIQNEEDEDDEN